MLKNIISLFILNNILFYPIKSVPDIENAKNLSETKIECKNNQSSVTYKIIGDSSNKIYRISKSSKTYITFYEDKIEQVPFSKSDYKIIYKKYTSAQLYLEVRFTYDSDCLSFIFFDSVDSVYLKENQNFKLPFSASLDKFDNIKIKDNNLNQSLIENSN